MTLEQVKQRLAAGNSVCDVGQLDARTGRWLRETCERGQLEYGLDYGFPSPKMRYWAPHNPDDPE